MDWEFIPREVYKLWIGESWAGKGALDAETFCRSIDMFYKQTYHIIVNAIAIDEDGNKTHIDIDLYARAFSPESAASSISEAIDKLIDLTPHIESMDY